MSARGRFKPLCPLSNKARPPPEMPGLSLISLCDLPSTVPAIMSLAPMALAASVPLHILFPLLGPSLPFSAPTSSSRCCLRFLSSWSHSNFQVDVKDPQGSHCTPEMATELLYPCVVTDTLVCLLAGGCESLCRQGGSLSLPVKETRVCFLNTQHSIRYTVRAAY